MAKYKNIKIAKKFFFKIKLVLIGLFFVLNILLFQPLLLGSMFHSPGNPGFDWGLFTLGLLIVLLIIVAVIQEKQKNNK